MLFAVLNVSFSFNVMERMNLLMKMNLKKNVQTTTTTRIKMKTSEPCAPCRGDGITYVNEGKKNRCPWCDGTGVSSHEVNSVFFRVTAACPHSFWSTFCVPEGYDVHGKKLPARLKRTG